MTSNITRATLVRPVALLACTAAMLILLFLTSGQSEARAVKDNAALSANVPAAAHPQKVGAEDSSSVAGQGGMGLAMPKIPPYAVVTDNFHLVPGQPYSLIYSDTTLGRSAFTLLNYNGMGGTTSVLRAWIECGYNPFVDQAEWPAWCPEEQNVNNAWGPTQYWLGSQYPLDGPYYDRNLLAGEGSDGWWLGGWDGAYLGSGACLLLNHLTSRGDQDYVIPMADEEIGSGSNTFVHLRALYTFHVQKSYAICSPPPGEPIRWYIEGVFLPK